MKIESEFTTAEVQTTERQSENGGQIINCLLTTENLSKFETVSSAAAQRSRK